MNPLLNLKLVENAANILINVVMLSDESRVSSLQLLVAATDRTFS